MVAACDPNGRGPGGRAPCMVGLQGKMQSALLPAKFPTRPCTHGPTPKNKARRFSSSGSGHVPGRSLPTSQPCW